MKKIALAFLLLTPSISHADGYILGVGRWSCADVVEAAQNGSPIQRGQLVGWILGYWSAITTTKPTEFIDIVERVGAETVYTETVKACQDSDPDVMLFQATQNIIKNTG